MDIGKLDIPESSGVYLMKKNNKVIYVGKAKNLKKRVSSYFNRVHESEKTNELVKNIEDIEFFLTNTEIDALLLENNLIKKYSPLFISKAFVVLTILIFGKSSLLIFIKG